MEDVKAELESLKSIQESYGNDSEYDMFLRFRELMIDKKFYRLVKEYSGGNEKILEYKEFIK